MLRWASLGCTLATLTWASVALGQQQESRAAQARKACLTGNVEAGVALLADLFVETKDANLIYNQARCYEQNGRAAEAILRFREYLRVAKRLSAEEKAEVDRHIADCRALEAEGKAATSSGLPAEAGLSPRNPPPPPATLPTAGVSAGPASSPAASGSGLRLAGFITGGAGIAALVTGGIFSYLVASAKQKAEDNATRGFYDGDLQSRGKSYETLQWVGYGAGAALVATGVVLYAVGAHRRSQARAVAILPSLAPGQGGMLVQGRF